ncbi:MAG: hypothetical protein H0V04_08155 [Chloroflexi bacterium]|nr:hypothetical protein [Chloroflexota bacterium]
MVFAETGDFDEREAARLRDNLPISQLPGFGAFLEEGIVAPMYSTPSGASEVDIYPDLQRRSNLFLGLARPRSTPDPLGATLGFLLQTLCSHLSISAVRTVTPGPYIGGPERWAVTTPAQRG